MSNYREYNNMIAFHPGYYVKEIVDESGLTQDDFARRLGTTPKNLSLLVRGEQDLSIDIAAKLSRMLGTSVAFWLNIQQSYNEKIAEIISEEELAREREVFKSIDYKYFIEYFGLPDLPRKVNEQIRRVREYLQLASLTVLKERDLAVSFKSYSENLSESNIVNANTMVQIAINKAIHTDAPKYNKAAFEKAVSFALTQTSNHENFLPLITKAFNDAGVVLIILPNLKKSGINGATKRVDGKIMLMVNDRRHYADTFWFALFHEIGHILNGDMGISYCDDVEDKADEYARNTLIPKAQYDEFIKHTKSFNENNIKIFADSINRDPGIVLGRLQMDKLVDYKDTYLSNVLRHKYKVTLK